MRKIQVTFASLGTLLFAAAFASTLYLTFVFPKTVAVWSDEGRALSGYPHLNIG